jgi:hypothetical protein
MINQSIEERNLNKEPEPVRNPGAFIPPQKEKITLRLDAGDYLALQKIVAEQGTKAGSLIRRAVKDIIKTRGGA